MVAEIFTAGQYIYLKKKVLLFCVSVASVLCLLYFIL